ncbi:hypothetical protein RPO42_04625, partial [Staphylococcus aureus]|nr:hypothetical protein [Staphylococcus aureus]
NKVDTGKLNENTADKQSTADENDSEIDHQASSSNLSDEQKEKRQSWEVETQEDSTETSNVKNEKVD